MPSTLQLEADFVEYGKLLQGGLEYTELAATTRMGGTSTTLLAQLNEPRADSRDQSILWQNLHSYSVGILPISATGYAFIEVMRRSESERSDRSKSQGRPYNQTRFTILFEQDLLQLTRNGQSPYRGLLARSQTAGGLNPRTGLPRLQDFLTAEYDQPQVRFETPFGNESILSGKQPPPSGLVPAVLLGWDSAQGGYLDRQTSIKSLLVQVFIKIIQQRVVIVTHQHAISLYDRLVLCEALQYLLSSVNRVLSFSLDYLSRARLDLYFVTPDDRFGTLTNQRDLELIQFSDAAQLNPLEQTFVSLLDHTRTVHQGRSDTWTDYLTHLQEIIVQWIGDVPSPQLELEIKKGTYGRNDLVKDVASKWPTLRSEYRQKLLQNPSAWLGQQSVYDDEIFDAIVNTMQSTSSRSEFNQFLIANNLVTLARIISWLGKDIVRSDTANQLARMIPTPTMADLEQAAKDQSQWAHLSKLTEVMQFPEPTTGFANYLVAQWKHLSEYPGFTAYVEWRLLADVTWRESIQSISIARKAIRPLQHLLNRRLIDLTNYTNLIELRSVLVSRDKIPVSEWQLVSEGVFSFLNRHPEHGTKLALPVIVIDKLKKHLNSEQGALLWKSLVFDEIPACLNYSSEDLTPQLETLFNDLLNATHSIPGLDIESSTIISTTDPLHPYVDQLFRFQRHWILIWILRWRDSQSIPPHIADIELLIDTYADATTTSIKNDALEIIERSTEYSNLYHGHSSILIRASMLVSDPIDFLSQSYKKGTIDSQDLWSVAGELLRNEAISSTSWDNFRRALNPLQQDGPTDPVNQLLITKYETEPASELEQYFQELGLNTAEMHRAIRKVLLANATNGGNPVIPLHLDDLVWLTSQPASEDWNDLLTEEAKVNALIEICKLNHADNRYVIAARELYNDLRMRQSEWDTNKLNLALAQILYNIRNESIEDFFNNFSKHRKILKSSNVDFTTRLRDALQGFFDFIPEYHDRLNMYQDAIGVLIQPQDKLVPPQNPVRDDYHEDLINEFDSKVEEREYQLKSSKQAVYSPSVAIAEEEPRTKRSEFDSTKPRDKSQVSETSKSLDNPSVPLWRRPSIIIALILLNSVLVIIFVLRWRAIFWP